MSELEPTTRALLSASRNADQPSPDELSRVERSLMLKIAAGVGASVGIGAATSKAAGATFALKLAGGALVAGLSLGASLLLATRQPAPSLPVSAPRAASPAAVGKELPSAAEPSPLAPAAPAENEPRAAGAKSSAKRAAASKTESSALKLKAEASLVGDAQRALGAGRAGEALERLAQYDQRFPGGALRSEADATRVFALCQSGRTRDADAAKQSFLRRYPRSPAAPRVRSACSTP